jgi:hypothetical protein
MCLIGCLGLLRRIIRMRRLALPVALVIGAFLWTWQAKSARAEDVDVALVLVSDVSGSINEHEYQLEKEGYVHALEDQQVVNAIQSGPLGKIGIAYTEFAGGSQVQTVVDWTIVRDAASARAFADQLAKASRSFIGNTAIGAGIEQAVQLLARAGFNARRRVIDVCGDGTNNAGPEVTTERDKAVRLGIVINGLAIINESSDYVHMHPQGGLAAYYRDNVTGGPHSFVTEVHDFATIGHTMIRKLISEISRRDTHTRLATYQTP